MSPAPGSPGQPFLQHNVTMATSNGTLDDGADPGEEDAYDASGALKFIVVTVGVYSLMGVISLLLVRILRRAKFRFHNSGEHSHREEFLSVRNYLRDRRRLQLEGHRQMLMHEKTKAALMLWNTDIPSLTKPLLTAPSCPHLPSSPDAPIQTRAAGPDDEREIADCPFRRQKCRPRSGDDDRRPVQTVRQGLLHEVQISNHPSSPSSGVGEQGGGNDGAEVSPARTSDCVYCEEVVYHSCSSGFDEDRLSTAEDYIANASLPYLNDSVRERRGSLRPCCQGPAPSTSSELHGDSTKKNSDRTAAIRSKRRLSPARSCCARAQNSGVGPSGPETTIRGDSALWTLIEEPSEEDDAKTRLKGDALSSSDSGSGDVRGTDAVVLIMADACNQLTSSGEPNV